MSARAGRGDPPPAPAPLPVPTLDSHCHLDAMADSDIATVLAAARGVGITRVVTAGDSAASSRWAAHTAAEYPDVWATVAIHPNETASVLPGDLAEIERLARLDEVRGVGETGLDYVRDLSSPATQQESFRWHIDLAKRVGKALVIHDRNAHADVLRILSEEGPPERTVFHCFSGDADIARQALDAGYVLSFAGTVTFTNAPALREAAALVPLEALLVETDAPFLAPVPFRGRPNAPYLVPHTVRMLAQVQRRELAGVCAGITATAARVFGFG